MDAIAEHDRDLLHVRTCIAQSKLLSSIQQCLTSFKGCHDVLPFDINVSITDFFSGFKFPRLPRTWSIKKSTEVVSFLS